MVVTTVAKYLIEDGIVEKIVEIMSWIFDTFSLLEADTKFPKLNLISTILC